MLTETVRMVNGRTSDVSKLDKTWITATTLYNLSCYYARKYARDKQPDDRKDALDRLGQYLARHDGEALERARRYAQNDPAFAPFATDPAFTSKVSPVPAPVVSAPPGPPGAVVVRASLDWGVGSGN